MMKYIKIKILCFQCLISTVAMAEKPLAPMIDPGTTVQETKIEKTPLPFPKNQGKELKLKDGTVLWFSIQNHKMVLYFLDNKDNVVEPKINSAKVSYKKKGDHTHKKKLIGPLQKEHQYHRPIAHSYNTRTKVVRLTRTGNHLSGKTKGGIRGPYVFSNITIRLQNEKLSFPYVKKTAEKANSSK